MNTKRLLQLFTKSALALIAVFALRASMVMAQDTWYVNSTEGDDTNDGSQMDNAGAGVGPFETIGQALTEASDDDTIIILAGNYTEDIDNTGLENLTFQVQSSGANTIAFVTGDVEVFEDVSFSGGSGTFELVDDLDAEPAVFLSAGALTLDAGILEVYDGGTVVREDGSVAGNAISYAGDAIVVYSPTNSGASPANVTSGLELPADGDLGAGGTIIVDDGTALNSYDDGTLTIDQAVTLGAFDVDGDADVVAEGTVTGSVDLDGDGDVTFEQDVDGGTFAVESDGDVTVSGTTTLTGLLTITDSGTAGSSTFSGTATVLGVDIAGDDDVSFANVELTGDDFDHAGGGDVTTADVDVDDFDLNQTGGGTFTMSSTLTIGDDEASGVRVNNDAGTMTIDDLVLEADDATGDDGSGGDADETLAIIIDNEDEFILNGTITEASVVDDDDGDETITYVVSIENADDAIFVFNSSTLFSGDVFNAASAFAFDGIGTGAADEGIQVGSGVSIIAASTAAFTDLGFWGGGTLEISGDGPDIDDLGSVGGFVLSGDRDITTTAFFATGDVDLQDDTATHTVVFDVDGTLTISGDAIAIDTGAASAHSTGGLSVTGTGFTLGDGDDSLTSGGTTDLGDGTIDGDLSVDDGDFTTEDGDVTGDFDVDGGSATFTGTSAFDGLFNVEEDVTVADGAALTLADVGIDASDVDGDLTVNGTVTLVDASAGNIEPDNPAAGVAGTNLTVGSVSIAFPDGELDLAGVDLIINGGFTGGNLTGADDVKVDIPAGGATFTPGPNTSMDFLSVEGSGRTLTVGEGFEVDTDGVFIQNDATVALGDNTITISGGDLTLEDEATVTTTEPTGALAFASGGAQSIAVTGAPTTDPSLSNIRVNDGSTVTVADDIDITGDLSLNDGTFDIDATVTMTGANATITRDASTGTLDTAGGTLAGEWDLVYFGDTGTSTDEFADGQVKDLTINLSDGMTIDIDDAGDITGNLTVTDGTVEFSADVGIAGNADVTSTAEGFDIDGGIEVDVDGNFTASADVFANLGALVIGGDATVDEAVDLGGALFFDGTGTVTLNGMTSGTQEFSGDYTVNGTDDTEDGDAEMGDITIDGSATVTINVQETGDVTVTDGTLTLNMVDDGDVGGDAAAEDMTVDGSIVVSPDGSMTLGGDGEVADIDDIFVDEGGSFTLAQDADSDGFVDAGDGGAGSASIDIATFTLKIGDDLLADDDASLSGTGVWEMDGNGDIDINGLTLVNLTLTDVDELDSDLTVSGTLDADDDLVGNGNTLFLSGDAEFAAGIAFTAGEFQTTGTNITLEGDADVNDFTVNSASTTMLLDDGSVGAPYSLEVTGDFTMDAGTLNLGDQELELSGGVFDYNVATGDAITMSGGQVNFAVPTAWDSDDVDVTLTNIMIDADLDLSNDGNDGLTVTGVADIDAGATFTTDDADAGTTNSTVSFADGSTLRIGETGVLAIFEEDPTLGADLNYEYDGGALTTTGNELATDIATFETDGTDVDIEDDVTVSVSGTITVDGILDLDPDEGDDQTMNLADNGTVVYEDGADLEADEPITFGSDISVIIRGLAASDDGELPDGFVPMSFSLEDDGPFAPHQDTEVVNATIDDDLDLDASTVIFTITGSLTVQDDGSFTTDTDAYVSMGGTEAQTMTFSGDAPEDLEIDNSAGVNLVGSDLDFATVDGTLILTDGPLVTGDNNVILAHGGTGDQGYTRTDGVILGNVQKYVETSGTNPNRIEFPTGDASGNYRPFALTFNDPAGDIGDIDTWTATVFDADMLLTATYDGTNPMGTNGLPITTEDSEGNELSIGRYPEFHWNVNSSPSVSPSVDYDVEFQAEGYANFAEEDVERMRAIRRQDGANTNFWILTSPTPGDNDNFAVTATEPVAVARNAVGAINTVGVLFTFGLEQNMMATDPAALTLNAGNTEDVDLGAVFDGGSEVYTYDVTSGDDDVATGAAALNGAGDSSDDVLTVTAVAAGATTLTVTATDDFGATATATVTVQVNAALALDVELDDVAVSEGADDQEVDASGSVTGGTGDYTYTVATSDAAVATATVDADGLVTVTFVGVGTATITVTVEDEEGDTVDSAFDVTVSSSVTASAIADQEITEGESTDVDVSGTFTGGGGSLTYTATSADDTFVTSSVDGSTVTLTAVEAYEAGTTIGTIDVTVTATDEVGDSASSTITVDVLPVLGDLTGSGPDPASASLALDFFLGLETLTAKQETAADFNGDGSVRPFDAALIFDAFFGGKNELQGYIASNISFGDLEHGDGTISVPVQISGELGEVVSASMATAIDPAVASIKAVEANVVDGWVFKHTLSEEGHLKIAMAGNGDMPSDGVIATITLELKDGSNPFDLIAEGAVNNNPTSSIDAVEVAELPETFALQGNYPNPFNPSTTVQFDLPETADVEIQLFDMLGRQVMTLPSQTIQAGAKRSVQVNASQLASGSYFYRVIAKMESKTLVESGRMMLVK